VLGLRAPVERPAGPRSHVGIPLRTKLVNVIADPDLPTQYADRRAPRRRSRNDRHKFRNGRVAAANRDLFPALGPRDELRQLRLRVADGDCLAHVAEATMTWPKLARSTTVPVSQAPSLPPTSGSPPRACPRRAAWASCSAMGLPVPSHQGQVSSLVVPPNPDVTLPVPRQGKQTVSAPGGGGPSEGGRLRVTDPPASSPAPVSSAPAARRRGRPRPRGGEPSPPGRPRRPRAGRAGSASAPAIGARA